MKPVEIIAAGLIFLFVFLGIILSLFPRTKQKDEPPKYKQSYRKYKQTGRKYIRREK